MYFFQWWSFSICLFRVCNWVKDFSHLSHWYLTFSCTVFICACKLPKYLKVLSQLLQLYFLNPSWMEPMWFFNAQALEKFLPQISHVCSICSSWISLMCLSRVFFAVYDLLQILHWNLSPSWNIFIWSLSLQAWANDFPHKSHCNSHCCCWWCPSWTLFSLGGPLRVLEN